MYTLSNEKNIYYFNDGKNERFYDINTGFLKSKNNRIVHRVPIKNLDYSIRRHFTTEESLTYSIFWLIENGYSFEVIQAFERIIKRIISYYPENRKTFFPYPDFPPERYLFIDKYFPKKQELNLNLCGTYSISYNLLYEFSLCNYYSKELHISRETAEIFYEEEQTELLNILSEIELKRIDKWVATDKVTQFVPRCDFVPIIAKAKEMNLEIPKTNNFTRWAYEVNCNYKIFMGKKNTEKIKTNYTNTKSIWNFENDDYIVKIPESVEDIVKEGNSQHNCVGTYVNLVTLNKTYICFIRRKINPEESFITCEVNKDGRIIQYLKSNNRIVDTEEELEFKIEFERHIKKQILNGVSL